MSQTSFSLDSLCAGAERTNFPFERCAFVQLYVKAPSASTNELPKSHVLWLFPGEAQTLFLNYVRMRVPATAWVRYQDLELQSESPSSFSRDTDTSITKDASPSKANAVSSAALRLGYGVFEGFTGVLLDPVKGARKDGFAGFFKVVHCLFDTDAYICLIWCFGVGPPKKLLF